MEGVKVIIQARSGSTRLKDKVLLPLSGKTILERVIERCIHADVGEVIVATTYVMGDLRIARVCDTVKTLVFLGHEFDVLNRYYNCAKQYGAKHIIRITSDCPLIDPDIIRATVDQYFTSGVDYCASRLNPDAYPDGMDVEIFSFTVLEEAFNKAIKESHREHVTTWIKEQGGYKCANTLSRRSYDKEIKFSVDTKEDYKVAKALYHALYEKNPMFGLEEIMKQWEEWDANYS